VATGVGTADAATTGYTYDDGGNLATMTAPNQYPGGVHWTYSYDARDRLTSVTDPLATDRNALGHTVDYTYDNASNRKSERRANDQIITYDSYDLMNRLTQMTVPQAPTLPAVTKYTWTRAGKIDTMTDPRNNVYNYDYDAQNRLATTIYPGGKTEARTYDFAGNLLTFKNRTGDVQTFRYDSRNRETYYSWSGSAAPARSLGYDDVSNIILCNDGSANISRVYYHDFRLKSETETISNYSDSTPRTVSYTYDGDGRRATIQYPSGEKFGYDYTGRGQLDNIYDQTAAAAVQASYNYDRSGNQTFRGILGKTTFDDPNFTTYHYDDGNRLTFNQHYWPGASRVFNYAYDEVGNMIYEKRDWANMGDGFQYDQASQITGYQREGTVNTTTGTVTAPAESAVLHFDANGNRTSVVDNSVTTTYGTANNLNQYPSVGGTNTTYDANGNLASCTVGADAYTFTYNAMNQLTHATKGTTAAFFWYDGFGRICTRQIGGGTGVRFNVYDGWNLIEEYNYNTGNTLGARYLYGEGELVSMNLGGVSGATYYFYQDGRGNNSQLAGAQGIVQENYKYDLNGTPTVYDVNNNELPNGSNLGNRFFFGGQQYFSEIGLYNLRNRFYLPEIGRFLQPDPIGFAGDAANLYRYCGNNPVNAKDPSGLDVTVTLQDATGLASPYGHIGLGVNTTATQGFYGSNSFNFTGVVGQVKPDNATSDQIIGSITITTTPAQDAIIAGVFAQFDQTNYAFFDRNCATAVAIALQAAGLKFNPSNLPNVLFANLAKAYPVGHGSRKTYPNGPRGGGGGGGDGRGTSGSGGGVNVGFGFPVFVGINNPTQSQLDRFIADNPGAQIGGSIPGLANGQTFVSAVPPPNNSGGGQTKPDSLPEKLD
jgi:RHS repeat-associated protein